MGADQSTYEAPLVPQQIPICAVEPRFCLPRPVQLRIREKMWTFSGDDFSISDPSDGTVYFKCAGRAFSIRDKKTLLDNMGQPVLNMKEALMSFTDKFTVYAGSSSDRMICKFHTEFTFLKAKISAQFGDVLNGQARYVVLKGDWASKTAVFYLGEPKQGGVPIGKVYRPLTGRAFFGADEYIIEIAPGVDISLLVIMCIALDEHKRDK